MATVKAKYNYHGSDGYRAAGSTWIVSDEEALALEQFGAVEIVTEEKEPKESKEKEDKAAKSTKEDKTPKQTK